MNRNEMRDVIGYVFKDRGYFIPPKNIVVINDDYKPNYYVGDFEHNNWNHRDEDGLGVLVDNNTPFKPISGVERKEINGTVYRVVDSTRPETIPGYVPGCMYDVLPGRTLIVDFEHPSNINNQRF
jgi:hypothetical protein